MSDEPKDRVGLEAEHAVLCAILLDPDGSNVDEAMDILRPEDFSRDSHVSLFRGMRAMHAEGTPIDPITLPKALTERGFKVDVAFLTYLIDVVPTAANLAYYARMVRDRSVMRRLVKAGSEIMELASAPKAKAEDTAARAESLLLDATDRAAVRGAERVKEPVLDAVALIERRHAEPATLLGIGTGLTELDEVTAGWQQGKLVIIAARPGGGKTALGLSVAKHAALRLGVPTVLFSLEMGTEELTMRMLADEALVNSRRLERGRVRDDEWRRIAQAAQALSPAPLYLDDRAEHTIGSLRAAARRLHRREGVRLVVVDYLQLVTGDEREENRQQEMRMVSMGLKAMAKQLQIPVIGMCQLNRQIEQRGKDSRPKLSDLRESGAVEQDADVVIFPWIHPDDEARYDVPPTTLIVAKQRSGPTGDVKVLWDRTTGRFEDLPTMYQAKAS